MHRLHNPESRPLYAIGNRTHHTGHQVTLNMFQLLLPSHSNQHSNGNSNRRTNATRGSQAWPLQAEGFWRISGRH